MIRDSKSPALVREMLLLSAEKHRQEEASGTADRQVGGREQAMARKNVCCTWRTTAGTVSFADLMG